ncbi:MAG: hypothetical protein CBB71_13575 [Rhodopirellula sp. TMED11]|nr:MAG: hypothetical protein CBB71_13575 [Rhodopirellula sp. TMED11]
MQTRMLWIVLSFIAATCLTLLPLSEAQAESASGRWKGGWYSNSTGHKGPMRAKIWKVDQNNYRAVFVGRFAKVVPFAYPARLQRVPGSNVYRSATRLPLLGQYQMNATIKGRQFNASYSSKRDRGGFRMSRR